MILYDTVLQRLYFLYTAVRTVLPTLFSSSSVSATASGLRHSLQGHSLDALAFRELARATKLLPRAPPTVPLADLRSVNSWMDSPELVDQNLDVVDRTALWMSLRM